VTSGECVKRFSRGFEAIGFVRRDKESDVIGVEEVM
jgi:hypothetical protein